MKNGVLGIQPSHRWPLNGEDIRHAHWIPEFLTSDKHLEITGKMGSRGSPKLNLPIGDGLYHPLVGGWPTPLKNMKANGKDYPIYYGKMVETTNQFCCFPSWPTGSHCFPKWTWFSIFVIINHFSYTIESNIIMTHPWVKGVSSYATVNV